MKIVVILLFVLGGGGILLGTMMFGDIGVAAIIGGLSAILSGVGFNMVRKSQTE